MGENKKTPSIRFAGFTDDWEQRKLNDLTSLITKGTTPNDKSWEGPVNYIKTESIDKESGILTNTGNTSLEEHEGFLKRSQLKNNDILFTIVGTLGRVGLVKERDLPANTNQQIAILRLNSTEPEFLLNYLKTPKIEAFISSDATIGAQPSISLWQLDDLEILIPSKSEQKKIGDYFSNLDNLIILHQCKYDKLAIMKKSMLEKMFPQNGSDVPEIRFEGFTEPWEQRKLSELVEENQIPIPAPTDAYVRLGIRSHAKGVFHEKVLAGKGLEVDTMYVVESDNLIVNITFAWEHAIAITTSKDAGKLVSHRFPQYKMLDGVSSRFLQHDIKDEEFRKKLSLASQGGAGRNRVLNKTQFLEIERIVPPTYEEQQLLGEYFDKLDNLITLHQRKLEKLKNIKKSMLEKMFV